MLRPTCCHARPALKTSSPHHRIQYIHNRDHNHHYRQQHQHHHQKQVHMNYRANSYNTRRKYRQKIMIRLLSFAILFVITWNSSRPPYTWSTFWWQGLSMKADHRETLGRYHLQSVQRLFLQIDDCHFHFLWFEHCCFHFLLFDHCRSHVLRFDHCQAFLTIQFHPFWIWDILKLKNL